MALSSALRFAVVGLGCSWFVLEYCMATAVGGRSVSGRIGEDVVTIDLVETVRFSVGGVDDS